MANAEFRMPNFKPVQSLRRGFQVTALIAFGILHSALGTAAAAPASVPVVAIEATRVADLVLLGGGFDAGLRQGMVCRVTRAGNAIAEVLLVDLRPTCSAALILSVVPKQSIRAGDVASIKILKS
jgi:hypothetical protein